MPQLNAAGTLNKWLRYDNGYTCIDGDCDNLVLNAPERLAPRGRIIFISEKDKPSGHLMRKMIDHQNPMAIAHVSLTLNT